GGGGKSGEGGEGPNRHSSDKNTDRGHLKVHEPHPWRCVLQPRQALTCRNPDRCCSIREGRTVARGKRSPAAGPIKGRLQPCELFHGPVAARKVISRRPVDRDDQIGKEAAILRRNSPFVALERKLLLLHTPDLPCLR